MPRRRALADLPRAARPGGPKFPGPAGVRRPMFKRLFSAPGRLWHSWLSRPFFKYKVFFDPVLALGLLLVSAPVIALAALLVKLTSRGPALYSQTRLGLNRRPFAIWKIRTMIDNCESLTGPRWAIPGDPRITPLGHLLRLTHIDELPQLWNVVRGDMGLIGPRPERPEFVRHLERLVPHYEYRLMAQPGITGLAQVQLPADSDLASVRRKLLCDLYYMDHRSLWLDFRILVCTLFKFFGVPFRYSDLLLNLPKFKNIEIAMAPLGIVVDDEEEEYAKAA